MSNNIRSIILNVTGIHPQTRQQRCVFKRFDGQGNEVDASGAVLQGPTLKGLGLSATPAPAFPQDKFQAAAAKGNYAEMNAISVAHAEQVAAWQQAQGGGSDELQVGRASLDYLYQNHGFLAQDGDGFVIKMDNIDVTKNELKDGGYHFLVTGTAVFGNQK